MEEKAVLASFTYTQDSTQAPTPTPRSVLCDAVGNRGSAEHLMRIRGLLILFTKALRALPCEQLTVYKSTSPGQLKELAAGQHVCTAGFLAGTRAPKPHEDSIVLEGALGYDITPYSFVGRDVVVMEPDAAFRVAKVEKGLARLSAAEDSTSVVRGGRRMSFFAFFAMLCLAVLAVVSLGAYFELSGQEAAATVDAARFPMAYRVYMRGTGWSAWTGSDNVAGTTTTGKGVPVEAVQIKYPAVRYQVHLEGQGWTKWHKSGERAGQVGNNTYVEAFRVKLLNVKYTARLADSGWLEWAESGEQVGFPGSGRAIEAIKIIKY